MKNDVHQKDLTGKQEKSKEADIEVLFLFLNKYFIGNETWGG